MSRPRLHLVVCGLVAVAGCLGGIPAPSTTSTPSTAPPTTPTAPSTLSAESSGDRAIAAERARIERRATAYDNLSGLGFGILRPAEYEVLRRNATGVVVRVTVGYSVSLDCDGDGDPDTSVDGAFTEATYLVSEDRHLLLRVSQDFLFPDGYC